MNEYANKLCRITQTNISILRISKAEEMWYISWE